jgi:predicted nuclease with TOPRIM domain
LSRLEAKVTLLEQEKSRLAEDLNRQTDTIQDLAAQRKLLESELLEKKNLVLSRSSHFYYTGAISAIAMLTSYG